MSRRTGSPGIIAISIALMVYHTDAADTVTLGELVCDSEIYDLNDGDSMSVKWDGTKLPNYCRLGFEAPDTSSSTCIKIEKFRLYNCGFYIEIYKNVDEFPTKRYDCSSKDIDEEYCLNSQKITYLKFNYNHTGIASFSPQVKLSVEVKADVEITSTEGIAGVAIPVIVFLFIVGGCGALIKHGMKCLCETLRELCGSICDCLSECVSGITEALPSGSSRAVQEDTPRNRTTEHTDLAITSQPGETWSRASSMSSLNFDLLIQEEPLNPSPLPFESRFDPPPYVGPLPSAPPAASLPDAPPPSYYDVMTMNDFKPQDKY
ncbi:uncharacterized protein LOC117330862 isoform X3 [Pecten maximus]|uniref:uncharacterized protein LOC117330862 isoform X3 n=1 Tax=Pecten maximus TaxID=6579 RepID=UPI0014581414|nr:uncharacterized protein LOC117330862 isoform X3 [Pecten maximus]